MLLFDFATQWFNKMTAKHTRLWYFLQLQKNMVPGLDHMSRIWVRSGPDPVLKFGNLMLKQAYRTGPQKTRSEHGSENLAKSKQGYLQG